MKHAFIMSCICLLMLTGCGSGGGDTKVETTSVSQGQELMDLQKARDSGAITASEYDSQKAKILKR